MGLLSHRRSHESMKRFYNWFHAHYGSIEKSLGPELDMAVAECVVPMGDMTGKTALEYACGSGLFTLKIAPLFRSVAARDLSSGMLSRAEMRAREAGVVASFREGDMLEIDEEDSSYDWVFVSFALHLFPPAEQMKILVRLLSVAREGVMIIDHSKKWSPIVALVEWIEGGYYDRFIKTDFSSVAERAGVSFRERNIGRCSVMIFRR